MSKKNKIIAVKGVEVTFTQTRKEDYISITDIAKYKNPDAPRDIIKNWMRSKNTIELLGLWEKLNNQNFKQVEFDLFRNEQTKELDWNIKQQLTKINYRIHTDAVKENLIPENLTPKQTSIVYANEADVLNMALFGKTAKQWREKNTDKKGNIRDYANVSQLVCLVNLENLNAVFINEGYEQSQRLEKLNQIAIQQMKILVQDHSVKMLNDKNGN